MSAPFEKAVYPYLNTQRAYPNNGTVSSQTVYIHGHQKAHTGVLTEALVRLGLGEDTGNNLNIHQEGPIN